MQVIFERLIHINKKGAGRSHFNKHVTNAIFVNASNPFLKPLKKEHLSIKKGRGDLILTSMLKITFFTAV